MFLPANGRSSCLLRLARTPDPRRGAALSARAERDWELYAAHRARLTEAVVDAARLLDGSSSRRRGARLCVLGAGNCNDLDLARLTELFAEIHLVDLDGAALARAVARQPEAVRARLRRHGEVDLSGLPARRLGKWKRVPPAAAEIEAASAAALDTILTKLGGPYDVVASTCVLTQMAFALRGALGDRHAALDEIRFGLMRTHLSTLAALTAPGGVALFASDVVSSTTYPLSDPAAGRALGDVLREVVASGAGYFAANPELVAGLLAEVAEPELLEPWLWTGPLDRTYLVYALRVRVPSDAES